MISIIIPTFKEPKYLDSCIESAIMGQTFLTNQIVVVVDGTYEENKEVLEKWKNKITPIVFETTMGQNAATNHGVYNSANDYILIVNDDNVFPIGWDKILIDNYQSRTVVTPNQIEPRYSIFKSFIIHDFGQTIETFNLKNFQEKEPSFRNKLFAQSDGNTLPIFMKRKDYVSIGGWDEGFPSGHVTDLDFFYKCNINNIKSVRNMALNFYHFSGVATRSPEKIKETQTKEKSGFDYFFYKWKSYPKYDRDVNFRFD